MSRSEPTDIAGMSPNPPMLRSFAARTLLAKAGHRAPVEGAIEWEELPSLVDTLADRMVVLRERWFGLAHSFADSTRSGLAWDPTRPAELEPARAPEPFHEPFNGLAVREVREPEVFRHFFGALKGF
jgi:hypothetical protein